MVKRLTGHDASQALHAWAAWGESCADDSLVSLRAAGTAVAAPASSRWVSPACGRVVPERSFRPAASRLLRVRGGAARPAPPGSVGLPMPACKRTCGGSLPSQAPHTVQQGPSKVRHASLLTGHGQARASARPWHLPDARHMGARIKYAKHC